MTTPEAELAAFETTQTSRSTAVPVAPPIPDDAKIAFLAHTIGGASFSRTYSLMNAGYVEFSTVLPQELDALRRLVFLDEKFDIAATPKNRNARLNSYLTIASINRLDLDGHRVSTIRNREWQDAKAYNEFLERIPLGLYAILESYYREFSDLFDSLVTRASDRSFW